MICQDFANERVLTDCGRTCGVMLRRHVERRVVKNFFKKFASTEVKFETYFESFKINVSTAFVTLRLNRSH